MYLIRSVHLAPRRLGVVHSRAEAEASQKASEYVCAENEKDRAHMGGR